MLKLIVNADDFGLNKKINKEIIRSYKFGIVRSASLMANGNAFDDAVEYIKQNPQLDIGIHLTLTGEHPAADSGIVSSLLGKDKKFFSNASEFAKKYFAWKISLDEVKLEFNHQIIKILDNKIKISHIDSHQHIHILPAIFKIVAELSNKYKIKYIRLPRENFQFYFVKRFLSMKRLAQLFSINTVCRFVPMHGFFTTDYFSGFYLGGRISRENLISLIHKLPATGICELMCHPGFYITSVSPHFNYRTVEEADALTDQYVLQILKEKNIKICSFRDADAHN